MASIIDLYCEPGVAAALTVWRTGVTNASATVDLTITPTITGLEATASTDGSGDDQGRIDITIPAGADPGTYTWSAEISSVVVWTGQIFVEENARNTAYVAHTPDLRSLTDPPFVIYRPEDLSPPGGDSGAATQLIESGGPTTLDISAIADGEYFRRIGDEVVGATPSGSGDVTAAVNFGADNRLVRSDGTTKGVQASSVSLTDAGALSGVTSLTLTDNIVMSASKTVDGRDVSVDGAALDALVSASSDTVTALSTFATDNRVLRSDGTGRGSQASTVAITDLGAMSGVTDLTITGDLAMGSGKTVDGRDVSADGTVLDAHLIDVSNPHDTTFLLLTDTPAVYTGAGGKVLAVKGTEDGVEFVTASSGTGDLVGPASSTDNALMRFDSTTGKLAQNSVGILSDTGDLTGIANLTLSGDITLSTAGAKIDGIDLTAQATTIAGKADGAASSTDNAVARFDLTTGKILQNSAVIIDDSANMAGVNDLTITGNIVLSTGGATVDGVDLTAQATTIAGKVTGPASATDNAVVRYDLTTGKLVQNSGVLIDDTDKMSGLAGLSVTGDITVTGTVDGVDVSALDTAVAGKIGGSTGSTDNRLLRADSTGGLTAQSSAVTLDDSGNLSGIASITLSGTVDGRDISTDGSALDSHLSSTSNPHSTTFLQLTDTPSSYTSQGGKIVKVKVDETGIEFANGGAGVSNFTDLGDAPATYTGASLKSVRVKSDETGLEFFTVSGTGDVVGPASATDNALVRYDSTTGKLVQNSVGILSDTGDLTGIANITLSGDITLSTAGAKVDGIDLTVQATTIAGKADGAASSTDNAIARFDSTTGKVLQNSAVTIDDSANIAGVNDLTLAGNITLSTGGATVDGIDLTAQATTISGKVTGPAVAVDNTIVRYDSTTGKLVQGSGVVIDDSDKMSGLAGLTVTGDITVTGNVDGVDVSALNTTVSGKIGGSTGATDNRLLRADGVGGLTAQSSTATLDDTGNLSGIADLTVTGSIVLSTGGATVDGRDLTSDGSALDALVAASANYVTAAAAFATDNRLLRSDGTERGSQASAVSLSDTGALSSITDLTLTGDIAMSALKTVDGRDVSADGATLDAHVANTSNPHSTTAAQVGAIATTAKGAASGVASLDASTFLVEAAQVLRATGVSLTLGSVTDGQYLVRSGTTVVGISPDLDTWVPGTAAASQVPRRNSGNTAFEWASLTASDVSAIATTAKGAASGVASLNSSTRLVEAAEKLYETGGPTTLTVGAVADGEYLKRSGSTIISAAVSSVSAVTYGAAQPSGGSNGDTYIREVDDGRWVKSGGTWAQDFSAFSPNPGAGASYSGGFYAKYNASSFAAYGTSASSSGTGLSGQTYATTNARTSRLRIRDTSTNNANAVAGAIFSNGIGVFEANSSTRDNRWAIVLDWGFTSVTASNFRFFSGIVETTTFTSDPTTASGHGLGGRIGIAIDANTSLAAKWLVNASNANQQNATCATLVADYWYRHIIYGAVNSQVITQELWNWTAANSTPTLVASTEFTATSSFTTASFRTYCGIGNAASASAAGTLECGGQWATLLL